MLANNRLRMMAFKNDFSITNMKYKEALKYYGFTKNTLATKLGSNMPIYPMPILKNSRTLTKQASLARLPVPSLETSVHRYLTAVKPLLNIEEFENTQKIAEDFLKNGIGEKLQKLLVEKSKSTDNWLAQWWLDKIYLEPRYSVVINVNPASIYPLETYRTLDEQLEFATKYICGFLDFKKYLEEQKLPVDKLGDAYLCMDQYYKLFGTCRIPKKGKDDIKIMQAYNINYERFNHITIIYNNKIFKLEIIDPKTGESRIPGEIYTSFKKLVNSYKQEEEIGLGMLTADNRDVWADCYYELNKNAKNRENFESINDSLFVLCLDTKDGNPDRTEDHRSLAAEQLLHGNKAFSSNRWFDKTVQVIIGVNGVWGVNFEHTISDALPHALMNDYIYKFILDHKNEKIIEEENSSKALLKELNFEISPDIKNQLKKSKETLDKQIENLDVYLLHFEGFGKDFPKTQKLSPDAFVQTALQLAFYRMHNRFGNAYESGSLRKFHLGRTEIIRACSSDTAEFVSKMATPTISSDEKASLFKKAVNAHRIYTNNVINFNTFDRHLLGLKLIAIENGIDLPNIYNDISFKKLCHYYISSSQVSSRYEAVTCFGPAVEDGYGVCYNIMEKKLIFGLSAFKSCEQTSAKAFAQHITTALLDCQKLLQKINSKL